MRDTFTTRDKAVILLHRIVSYAASDMPTRPFGLSFLMVTKNNQSTIQQALDSIAEVADEIIVIDGSPQQQTFQCTKAKHYAHRTSETGWDVFVDSLNFGLTKCSYRWVLKWDADMIGSLTGLQTWKNRLSRLNPDIFYEIDLGRIDASKTVKFGGYEGRLFTPHPDVKYQHDPIIEDRIIFPLWYRLMRWTEPYITHLEPR